MIIKPAKIGPWGGHGGNGRDVQVAPFRLLRLTVRSGDTVDSIYFSYLGSDGNTHHEGPWGGSTGGHEHVIELGLMDYVKEISGTTGAYTGFPDHVVRSLKIVTFKHTYGPYGAEGVGTPFRFPVQGSTRITGFFGRSGHFLDAIGFYVRP